MRTEPGIIGQRVCLGGRGCRRCFSISRIFRYSGPSTSEIDEGETRMTKHWTLQAAALTVGACVIGAMAVPMAQGGPGRTVWDGVYSEAQAARGKAVSDAQCAYCHQPDLRGQGFAPARRDIRSSLDPGPRACC